MHEKNFVSSWLREDGRRTRKERTLEVDKEIEEEVSRKRKREEDERRETKR